MKYRIFYILVAVFSINIFSNSYIEFNAEELEHFNKYYNYEDYSRNQSSKEMGEIGGIDLLLLDIKIQKKVFLKKAKKNKEDSVFLSCQENKWLFKDKRKEIFIVLNSLRSEAFLATDKSTRGIIYKLSTESQFYNIGTKPSSTLGEFNLKTNPRYKLDTNTLILFIYSRYYPNAPNLELVNTPLSGSRSCTKMNYSEWLTKLLSFVDKIEKEDKKKQDAIDEENRLKF